MPIRSGLEAGDKRFRSDTAFSFEPMSASSARFVGLIHFFPDGALSVAFNDVTVNVRLANDEAGDHFQERIIRLLNGLYQKVLSIRQRQGRQVVAAEAKNVENMKPNLAIPPGLNPVGVLRGRGKDRHRRLKRRLGDRAARVNIGQGTKKSPIKVLDLLSHLAN